MTALSSRSAKSADIFNPVQAAEMTLCYWLLVLPFAHVSQEFVLGLVVLEISLTETAYSLRRMDRGYKSAPRRRHRHRQA